MMKRICSLLICSFLFFAASAQYRTLIEKDTVKLLVTKYKWGIDSTAIYAGFVPNTRTVNSHALSSNVVLTTSDIAEGSNLYFSTARVLATALTGLSLSTSTAITATDNILVAMGKLQAQVTTNVTAIGTKEPALGNPSVNGYVLSSTTSGTRSWVAQSGGSGMAIGGAITSATAGSVLYAGTNGLLQQSNSKFFWDSTNNRFGIGIATPLRNLHVAGGELLLGTAEAGVDNIRILASNGSGKPEIQMYDAGQLAGFITVDVNGFNFNSTVNVAGSVTTTAVFKAVGIQSAIASSLQAPIAGEFLMWPAAGSNAFLSFGENTIAFHSVLGTATSTGDLVYKTDPSNSNVFNGTERFRVLKATGDFSLGLSSDIARFGVKGGGSTSATYSIKVQNSGATELFSVRDDGLIGAPVSILSPKYSTTATVFWSSGTGSPEGVVTAGIGSVYTRTDGGALTTLYIKESGSGNTGWIAK